MIHTGTITDYLPQWLAAKFWPALKRTFCDHRHQVYEAPQLRVDVRGAPYVISKHYCSDCGKGLPFPPYHNQAAAAQMLIAYRGGELHAEADRLPRAMKGLEHG